MSIKKQDSTKGVENPIIPVNGDLVNSFLTG
jgi:hypothetical protein